MLKGIKPVTERTVGLIESLPAFAGWFDQSNTSQIKAGLVPLISWVAAGEWTTIVDNFQPGDAEDWLPCPFKNSPQTYALRVRGPSMSDPTGEYSFNDGEIIFVDPMREARHKSFVVVRMEDDQEATFKRLIQEGDRKYLMALNPNWPNRVIEFKGKATLSGVVIGKVQPIES